MMLSGLSLALTRPRGAGTAAVSSAIDLALVSQSTKYAYGSGRVVKGYNGSCFRARRVSDSTTLDVSAISTTNDNVDWAALDTWAGAQGYQSLFPYDQSGNANDCTAWATSSPWGNTNAPKAAGARPWAFPSFSSPTGVASSGQFVLPAAIAIDPASHWTVIVAGVANDGATSGTASYMATWGTSTTKQQLRSGTGAQTAGGALALVDTRAGVTTAQCTVQNAVTAQLIQVVARGAGTPVEFYVDAQSQSVGAVGTSVTATGGFIGGDGTSAAANMNLWAWFEFAGPPTTNDRTYVQTQLNARFGLGASPDVAVTWFGSSTMGEYRSLANGLVRRTSAAMTKANLSVSAGIAGTTMAQMVTGKAYLSGMKQAGKYNVAVVSQARNDANALISGAIVGGETAIFANQMTFTTQLIADGWDKVIWLPSFDTDPVKFSGSGTDQTQKATVITNGAALLAAGVNGASGNPQYTCWNMHDHTAVIGPAYGTAAFDSDAIHTLEATQALLATTAGGLAVGVGLAAYIDSQCTLKLTGTIPASGTSGVAYNSAALTALNAAGAVAYTVQTGSLPTGLTLNAATGAITGTPTVSGAYSGTIRGSDGVGTYDLAFSIGIDLQRMLISAARDNGFPTTASATYYGAFNSQMPSVGSTQAWSFTTHRGATMTLSSITSLAGSNGRSTATTVTLQKNGSDTALTCSIGAGVTTAVTTTATVTIADGDTYNWKVVTGTGAGTMTLTVAISASVFGQSFVQFGQLSQDATGFGTKKYYSVSGNNSTLTETDRTLVAMEAFTASSLQAIISANTCNAATVITLRRAIFPSTTMGATALTVTVGAGSTTFQEDSTHSVVFADGDLWSIEVDASASASGSITVAGLNVKYTSGVANRTPFYCGSALGQTALCYSAIMSRQSAQVSEAPTQLVMPFAGTFSGMFERITINSATAARLGHFRVNGATVNNVVSVTGLATGVFRGTGSDVVAANDKVNFMYDAPNIGTINMSGAGILLTAA